MKTMKKRAFSALLALLLSLVMLLPFAVSANANDNLRSDNPADVEETDSVDWVDGAVAAYNSEPVIVADFAHLLTEDQIIDLKDRFVRISSEYGIDIALVTRNYLENTNTIDDEAEYWYNYESNLKNKAVFLTVCMSPREYRVTAVDDAQDVFFDELREYISDEIYDDMHDGNYYSAFSRFTDLAKDVLQKNAAGTPYTARSLKKKNPIAFVIAIAAGLLIGTLIMSKYKSQLKTVHMRNEAGSYIRSGSMNVTKANDMFLYSRVTRVKRQTESSSGGSHSSHHSSGGHSFGHSGRSF